MNELSAVAMTELTDTELDAVSAGFLDFGNPVRPEPQPRCLERHRPRRASYRSGKRRPYRQPSGLEVSAKFRGPTFALLAVGQADRDYHSRPTFLNGSQRAQCFAHRCRASRMTGHISPQECCAPRSR
jgi:hypothetical protein